MDEQDEALPADRLYREGISFGEVIFSNITKTKEVWERIDWDQEINAPDDVLLAERQIATQLHYMKLSHLILLGSVLKFETMPSSLDAQKLSAYLVGSKIDGLDVWGRYIGRTPGKSGISPAMQDYFRELFNEEDPVAIFLGIEVLSLFVHELYDEVGGPCDPLFAQIAHELRDRKEEMIDIIPHYMRPVITELDEEEKRALEETADQYFDLAVNVLESEEDALETLGLHNVREKASDRIDQFYADIGLNSG